MDIVNVNLTHPAEVVIEKAVSVLKAGGVVMYPTDTAYGLAADIGSKKAVEKIFKIKTRMKDKTLPLIAGSIRMVGEYAKWTPLGKRLAKKYWPGPLTVVLESCILSLGSSIVCERIVQKGRIAVRVPDCKIARMISEKLGRPITSTSANKSENPECYSAAEFLNQMTGEKFLPDLILDAGRLPERKPSTIADATIGSLTILRQGTVRVKISASKFK